MSARSQSSFAEIQTLAQQIANVCAVIGERPTVRYSAKGVAHMGAPVTVPQVLALGVQAAMDEAEKNDPKAFVREGRLGSWVFGVESGV